MKVPKKKKLNPEELEDDGRPVRFEALEELTHGDIVEQLKMGISNIEALENEDQFRDDAAA